MNINHNLHNMFLVSCNVIQDVDWFGNYAIHSLTDCNIKRFKKIKHIKQYISYTIDNIKEHIIKKIPNINNLKWNINAFDETISLHILMRDAIQMLSNFIITNITNYDYKPNDINKSIIISITNDDIIVFVGIISLDGFL